MSGAAAWAAGTSFTQLTGRGAAGPNTASIYFGGAYPNSPGGNSGATEKYDGTTWTEVNNLTTPRNYGCPAQQGSQTAAFLASGTTVNVDGLWCETYDGTSWSAVPDTAITHAYSAGVGTSTAALAVGTAVPPRTQIESWNGSSWSEGNDMNTGRYFTAAAGSQTAALCFSGETLPGPFTNATESWNGTSWSAVNAMNTTRCAGGGAGTQALAIAAGGKTPTIVNNVETWDGTSWSAAATLATARKKNGTTGTTAAGMTGGGSTSPPATGITDTVEIWSDPVYAVKTVTVS